MSRKIAVMIVACIIKLFILRSMLSGQDLLFSPVDFENRIIRLQSTAVDSLIRGIIAQTNLDTLLRFVRILSGEDSVTINDSTYLILSRHAVHPHNDLAADFIFQTLSRYGLAAFNQQYSVTGRNVYAVQTGTEFPDQKYIICAHYDDMPMQPPAPGADDNASGTAAVLEAARILSQMQTFYTAIYALWDEEEQGLIGSAHYALQAFRAGENIHGVINVDMLGWDENGDGLCEIQTRPVANSEELARMVVKMNEDYQIGLNPVINNFEERRSDHASFWKQDYGAIHLIEAYLGGDFNPFYHTPDDRIDKFDLDYFHAMSKLAVSAISHLALCSLPAGVDSLAAASVAGFVLKQNYPNPFNPSTTIEFALPNPAFVTLKVYNLMGEEVATLVAENLQAGKHQRVWEAKALASGMYLYRIEAGEFIKTKKLILLQ